MKRHTTMFSCLFCLILWRVNCLDDACRGDPEQKENCAVLGENGNAENVEEEMNVELLQRDLNLKRKNGQPPYTEITMAPWPCNQTNLSYQSTTPDGNTKSMITKWDIKTGGWDTVLTLWPNVTDPPYRSLNACGINPVNDVMYCALVINNKGTFLVAIDHEKVGYVAKLLGFRYSATFDNKDTYYVSGSDYRLAVVKDVSKLPVWSSWSGLDAHCCGTGETAVDINVSGVITQDPQMGSDYAFIEADLRGQGKEGYLCSLTANLMKILVVTTEPYELFTLNIKSGQLPPYPSGSPRVWGTAWAYRETTSMYFSADDGVGLYAADALSIRFHEKKVFLSYVGKAIETDWNDGLSCGKDPWVPNDVKGCSKTMYRSMTDGRWTSETTAAVVVMDPDTGKVVDGGWSVDCYSLNCCAVNPKDNKIYCSVQTTQSDGTLARLDDKGTIAYVYNYPPDAKGGTFDDQGNYWVFGGNPGLFKTENIQYLMGFSDASSLGNGNYPPNAISESYGWSMNGGFGDANDKGYSGNMIGSDMEVLEVNESYYLISLPGTQGNPPFTNFQNRLSVIDITAARYSGGQPHQPTFLYDTTNTLPKPLAVTPEGQTPNSMTWGSAWKLRKGKGFIYLFASDDGQGIFRLIPESMDFENLSVKFEKYGKADSIEWNNGFSCLTEDFAGLTPDQLPPNETNKEKAESKK